MERSLSFPNQIKQHLANNTEMLLNDFFGWVVHSLLKESLIWKTKEIARPGKLLHHRKDPKHKRFDGLFKDNTDASKERNIDMIWRAIYWWTNLFIWVQAEQCWSSLVRLSKLEVEKLKLSKSDMKQRSILYNQLFN